MRNEMRGAVMRIMAIEVQGSRTLLNNQMQAATIGQAAPIMPGRCRIAETGMI